MDEGSAESLVKRVFKRGIDESVVDRTRSRVGSVREEAPAVVGLLHQASCSLANDADCETIFESLASQLKLRLKFSIARMLNQAFF